MLTRARTIASMRSKEDICSVRFIRAPMGPSTCGLDLRRFTVGFDAEGRRKRYHLRGGREGAL